MNTDITIEKITIAELDSAESINGNMIFPAANGAADVGVTVAQLRNYINSFVSQITEEERAKLSGLENAPADWRGTQAEYDALTARDAGRWYMVQDASGAVVAVYRGDALISAEPNCVGEFAADSLPDDWYWWPNGVKTALPVDPATCRFSFYYPTAITGELRFYDSADPKSSRLISLERIPTLGSKLSLDYMPDCKVMPTFDCPAMESLMYVLLGRTWAPTRLHFKNTDKVKALEMMLNVQRGQLKILTGLDCSSLLRAENCAFSVYGPAYMPLMNLGKAAAATTFDLRNTHWGDDTIVAGARQTLVDSLLTNSFDRAAAGYGTLTLQLSPEALARLTSDEVAAITAKGYTLTSVS